MKLVIELVALSLQFTAVALDQIQRCHCRTATPLSIFTITPTYDALSSTIGRLNDLFLVNLAVGV